MPKHEYALDLDAGLRPSPVRPALVWAVGIAPPETPESMPSFLGDILARVRKAGEDFLPPERKKRVRAMLRHGRYKPSGRGKPASEYLLRAALDPGLEFPLINIPVAVNNAVSLGSGWPASIFDIDLSGPRLRIRRGRAGESYIFNPAGQRIDLEDLLCVCRPTDAGWEPCGNPVKDALATKLGPSTQDVIAVIYAPVDEPPAEIESWASRYAEWLSGFGRAESSGYLLTG